MHAGPASSYTLHLADNMT